MQVSFHPILDSYLLVTLLTVLLVGVLLVRPLFAALSRGRRRILWCLRAATISLVILAMLRPTLVHTEMRAQNATVAILWDDTRSMQTTDVGGNLSRWEAQRETLMDAQKPLEDLARRFQVRLYEYQETAKPVDLAKLVEQLKHKPNGSQTDLGTAVDEVLRQNAGQRLAAVVLMGDGAQRSLDPRVDLQQPVRELARNGVPLYTIVYGKSRDQTQARDVSMENMPDDYTIFAKNQLLVQGTLRIQGYVNQPIPVTLTVEGRNGMTESVGPVMAMATAEKNEVSLTVPYRPNLPGAYKLTLTAAPQAGELITENNSLSAFLTVLDGGMRALYLDGNVGWQEQKFVRRAIDGSPEIQMDFQWIDSRQRESGWPVDLVAALTEQPYDVILLRDVDADALGPAGCQAIADFVGEKGKGLIMMGGYHSFGPGGFGQTRLSQVLPIEMGQFERQKFGDPIRKDRHREGPLSVKALQPHSITTLGSTPAESARVWGELPPLMGANRFQGVSDRATVLLESTQQEPLLVVSQFGVGRVAALATDSTFRWFRQGFKSQHQRFWRQLVLWTASKEDMAGSRVWVRVERRRLDRGKTVSFTTGIRDPQGNPQAGGTFVVALTKPDGSRDVLRVAADSTDDEKSHRGVTDILNTPGDYRIQVTATDQGKPVGTAETNFSVADRDLELTDPAADPKRMQVLADLTATAGGRMVPPEQLPQLLEEIKNRPLDSQQEFQETWQLADTAPDAWAYFGLLVALLSTEWYLRKKWNCV